MKPRILLLTFTAFLLPGPRASAQSDGTLVSRTLPGVSPLPNGIVNVGTVFVDERGLSVLAMTPQILLFEARGQTQQLSVRSALTDRSDFAVDPSVYGIVYGVVNPAIASVASDGLVTAVSSGTTLVTATSLGATVRSIVVVNPLATVTGLQVSPGATPFSSVGDNQQLQVSAAYSTGLNLDVTSQSSTTYASSNPSAATVSPGGLVTAAGAGTATITASYGAVSSTASVAVTIAPADVLTGIALDAPAVVRSSAPVELSVAGELAGGGASDLTPSAAGTSYQTSASSVAAVTADGALTAAAPGTTLVTATNSGFSATAAVRVSFSSLQSLTLTPSSASVPLSSVSPVSTLQLQVAGLYTDGTQNVLSSSASGTAYVSSNPAVAGVSPSGLVTFTQPGAVAITASNDGVTASAAFTVTLMNPVFLSYFPGSGFTGVAVSTNLVAYVTAGTSGLEVIDARAPAAPYLAAAAPTTGNMVDVKTWAGRAYAAETDGLAVFDVTVETAPLRLATFPGTDVTGAALGGGNLYFVDGAALHIYDAASLTPLGQLTLPRAGLGVSAWGDAAYVIDAGQVLDVVSAANPAAPVLISTLSVPGAGARLTAAGTAVFVAAPGNAVIDVVDVSTPGAPAVVGQASVGAGAGVTYYDAAVQNGLLVAAMYAGVGQTPVFNVTNPRSPAYVAEVPTGSKHAGWRVDFVNGFDFVIDNGAGGSSSPGLYIGAVVPPSVQNAPAVQLTLTSPYGTAAAAEGAFIAATSTASSDVGVARMLYSVNGVVQSSATTGPRYAAVVQVPAGTAGTSINVCAQAQDVDAVLSNLSCLPLNVIVDPLTTAQGTLMTSQGAPVPGVAVSLPGGLQTVTGADGGFMVTHVPTAQGNVVLSATATVSGYTLYANLSYPPVPAGVTNFGNVVMNGNVTLSGSIAGQTLVPLLSPYVISGAAVLPAGQTLTAPAGTIVKFAPAASLTVQGALIATGAAGAPATFTSLQDESVGGDTGDLGPAYGFPSVNGALNNESIVAGDINPGLDEPGKPAILSRYLRAAWGLPDFRRARPRAA